MNEQSTEKSGSAPSGAPLCVLVAAGLVGASGVALAAVAAHRIDSPALATAAMMLMLHATAGVALLAVSGRMSRSALWQKLAALMLGAVALFSGDIALHAFTGARIFPMAAPTGGSLLIASWLGVALLAALELRRLK